MQLSSYFSTSYKYFTAFQIILMLVIGSEQQKSNFMLSTKFALKKDIKAKSYLCIWICVRPSIAFNWVNAEARAIIFDRCNANYRRETNSGETSFFYKELERAVCRDGIWWMGFFHNFLAHCEIGSYDMRGQRLVRCQLISHISHIAFIRMLRSPSLSAFVLISEKFRD